MAKKKTFIICPVRNVSEETNNKIIAHVTKLETNGYEVYWPYRDNPHQNTDKTGIAICEYNRKKMLAADEIHIWHEKTSTGSVFDVGMFFAFVHVGDFKKFIIINREDVAPTPHKSFENVILALGEQYDNPLAGRLRLGRQNMENKIPKVFICIRLRPKSQEPERATAEFEENLKRARVAARYAVLNGFDPEATTIYFTQFLDDSVTQERELGMKIGQSRLARCDEIWDIRDADEKPSTGMASDLKFAGDNHIVIKRFDFAMIKSWIENHDKTSK